MITIQRSNVEVRLDQLHGEWCLEFWLDGECRRVIYQRGSKEQAMREAFAGIEELAGLVSA